MVREGGEKEVSEGTNRAFNDLRGKSFGNKDTELVH